MGDSQRHERVQAILFEAFEVEPSERDAFLDRACGDDAALRSEVCALLQYDSADETDLLGAAARTVPGPPELRHGAAELPPTIGPYRVLGELGRGGMGVVYRAASEELEREVALKVVRSFGLPETGRRRFEREAKVLARLHHVGIAQVFESGSAEVHGESLPYFAMELVDGLPITEHAGRDRLALEARIELVAQACDAIQHAHERGVVHRDIKPSNLLVDESGRVKVLDFGISRLTDSDSGQASLETRTGQVLGTLAYMSPEQASGRPDAVGTGSDVYALGALAYELFGGRPPLDLAGLTAAHALRAIQETEPARLSSHEPSLRGDVETIVSKALRKEESERYAAPAELAADLRRFLRDEPIAARPPSTVYRARKFVRRQRALVTATGIVFAALLVGAGVALHQRDRAIGERDAAVLAREDSDVTLQYVLEVLYAANPEEQFGDISLREFLDDFAAGLDAEFQGKPHVDGRLRTILARSFHSTGRFDDGLEHAVRARELLRPLYGSADTRRLEAAYWEARCRFQRGEVGECLDILRRSIAAARDDPGAAPEALARQEYRLAVLLFESGVTGESLELAERLLDEPGLELTDGRTMILERIRDAVLWERGELEDAERRFRDLVARSIELEGENSTTATVSRNLLAELLVDEYREDEARELLDALLSDVFEAFGPEHRLTFLVQLTELRLLMNAGRFEEALDRARFLVDDATLVLGPRNPTTVALLRMQGAAHYRLGELEPCIDVLGRVSELRSYVEGSLDDDDLTDLQNLGSAYLQTGQLDLARSTLERVHEAKRVNRPPSAPTRYRTSTDLGRTLIFQGELARADAFLEAEIRSAKEHVSEDDIIVAVLLQTRGLGRIHAKELEAAEPLLEESYRWFEARLETTHPYTQSTAQVLVHLYEQWGRPEAAEPWRPLAGQ